MTISINRMALCVDFFITQSFSYSSLNSEPYLDQEETLCQHAMRGKETSFPGERSQPADTKKHDSPSNNRSLDFALSEAVTTFDQFFQPRGEACCWNAVDEIMIQADRETEIFPDLYSPRVGASETE